ncbi:MAG: hypothetical protein ACRDNF_08325, partial [Streptosporangiaceae bacterium]
PSCWSPARPHHLVSQSTWVMWPASSITTARAEWMSSAASGLVRSLCDEQVHDRMRGHGAGREIR